MPTPEQITWTQDFLGLDLSDHTKPPETIAHAESGIRQAWSDAAELVSKDFKSVDGAAHELGSGMDHAAEAGIERATDAINSSAGNAAEKVLRGAAEGVRGAVKQEVALDYGVAAGVAEAVGGIIKNTGDLIGDSVRFATDGQFRDHVVEGAKGFASTVVHDPLGTTSRLGQSAIQAGRNWERDTATAVQKSDLEYVGRGIGSAIVDVGIALIPGTGEAEAANFASKGEETAEALGLSVNSRRPGVDPNTPQHYGKESAGDKSNSNIDLHKSTPVRRGTLIGDVDLLTNNEYIIINDIIDSGDDVEIISPGAKRTPDVAINGIRTELKTLSKVQNTTNDGLSSALSSRIMDGRGQASNILVDARRQSGMTKEIALRGISRAFGSDRVAGALSGERKLKKITVWTPEGSVIGKIDD